ncbi:MAG: epoxyqueuosine reductase [Clostridia bacterium]|nr:epoxyqueuosine reductase [Clostridia bacterium]
MDILERARELLEKEKIEYVSSLALSDCPVVRPYLLERAGIDPNGDGSVIIFAVPYYISDNVDRNVSLYAVPKDYHLYFKGFFDRVLGDLRVEFPSTVFAGFSDHSPIDEMFSASLAGLGVIGKNGLLITEKYSSFVFLGEIICDAELPSNKSDILSCEDCGLCKNACPVGLDKSKCISSLTQKKGNLDEKEVKELLGGASVWGCDICQSVCPHTKNINETDIEFFKRDRLPHLTLDKILKMTDSDFSERAYSWRGKDTILRNLRIFEDKK